MSQVSSEPLCSIVIPTYNSERHIKRCLESIKNQTYKNIEVIVVDKFSTDRTVEIAESFGAKVIRSEASMSEARNIGLQNVSSESEYVMFIDSDMELSPGVIEECVKIMEENNKIGGIIIPERSVGNTLLSKIRAYERRFYENTDIEAARFFRKDLAIKVGGYDSDVIFYEDHTLPQKIEKLGFHSKARIASEILHYEDHTLFKWMRKKIYYGKTKRRYEKKYPEYANRQVNILWRLSLFLKNKEFYRNPVLAMCVLILKMLEFLATKIGELENG